jgi:hypothetical protein
MWFESMIDVDARQELARQLGPGERLLWAGRPRQGIFLRSADLLLIPFSLLWGGFAFFWEYSVATSNAPFFMSLWGIPFVLIGVYFIVGRFFVDARQRARTFYGLTNERVLIVSGIRRTTVRSLQLRSLSDVALSEWPDGTGTLTFGPVHPFQTWHASASWPGLGNQLSPTLESVPSARAVYDSIRAAQREAAS